jgi:hypothetical protein
VEKASEKTSLAKGIQCKITSDDQSVVLQGAMRVLTQSKTLAGDAVGRQRSSLWLAGSGLGLLDTAELHSLVLNVLFVSASLSLLFLDESGLINEQS